MIRSKLKLKFSAHNTLAISLVLLAAAMLISACQRRGDISDQAPELTVIVRAKSGSTQVGSGEVIVELRDATGQPVSGANMGLRGDMSHAGMAPVLATAHEVEAGIYEAPFNWIMAGEWFLTINADLPDGRKLLRTEPVTVLTGAMGGE